MGEKAKRNTTGLRNLADLPPDVRREIQSRGGKASAAKRKEAKMVREALLELLTKPSRSTKGKGNASKDEMIGAMRQRGFQPGDDNEADALAILLWAIETQEV